MSITPLPDPPLRSDGPIDFAYNAEIFLSQLPIFATEANALAANVNAKEASAASSASTAADMASTATDMAAMANSASNYKGLWASLAGALNMPASVYHAGEFWVLNVNLANVTTATPGVSSSWTLVKTTKFIGYENRGTLRNLVGDMAVIDGLGLFFYVSGSDEPDDDESCFATTSGRWLLQAAHWDLVDAWQSPDDAVRDEDDEDEAHLLTGSATCTITSIVATSSISFNGIVSGAAVGDRVIATPPGQLGNTATDTGCLNYYAWVSAPNTVTVMLCNPSAITASTNSAIRAGWPITVIKT